MVDWNRRHGGGAERLADFVRRHRPGHHQHAVHDLRPRRRRGRAPPARTRTDPAEGRLGRAQPRRDLGTHRVGDRVGAEQDQAVGHRPGRAGHHQPAGNRAGVGPAHRQAVLQRDRLAGHPHRPHRLGAGPRRPRRRHQAQGRAAACHLLLRRQGAVDSGERRRGPRRCREGRRDLRHPRHLGAVESHRRAARRRARHRRDQRQPDHADESGDAGLGRRTAVVLRHSAADAARDQAVVVPRVIRHHPRRRAASRAGADHRDPRRPAGRDGRAGVSGRRRGQEHLWHRQFPAAQHR